MKIEMMMPRMGESIMEATVLTWLKKVGDSIQIDDPLLEVATDKVDTEVPATMAGILIQILVPEGAMAEIGKPLCILETTAEGYVPATNEETLSDEAIAQGLEAELNKSATLVGFDAEPLPIVEGNAARFYSPLVLNIAKEEGISQAELQRMVGSGKEGRVTKEDMLTYLETRKPIKSPAMAILPKPSAPKITIGGQDEIIQMDRMRKMIAERMVQSKQLSAHVTSFVETDMTKVSQWREKNKAIFQKEYNENLTYTPILLEAIVKAIKDFPMINVQVEGDTIIKKNRINVGMAVALPSGNLIVPVIHDADTYDLIGLTRKVNDLTRRARENKLKAEDLANGTYTFSNIGTFGNIMGTPIIVQPQVAIMAFGAIQKKPAVIETPDGDLLGIRQKMFISHSYDHRVIDGFLGGSFLKRVSDYLEGFEGIVGS